MAGLARIRVTALPTIFYSITLALTVCLLSLTPALSWGSRGHHIIARIAAGELTPKTNAAVADLLGGEALPAMVTASTYADEIRPSRRETAPWHYVNIEIGSNGYSAARDCREDACLVAQIEHEEE